MGCRVRPPAMSPVLRRTSYPTRPSGVCEVRGHPTPLSPQACMRSGGSGVGVSATACHAKPRCPQVRNIVHVYSIYRRLRIGRDGHLDKFEAYNIS